MKNLMARFVRDEEGQDLIEYSLLAALIAVGSIVVMNEVGDEIDAIFRRITAALQAAPGA
jgi:pilus assembly protein Flp/PilA